MTMMTFTLDGTTAAGGTVRCRGEDAEGRTAVIQATCADGADPMLGFLANELIRRSLTFKRAPEALEFAYGSVTDAGIPVMYCYPKGAVNAPLVIFNHGTGGCGHEQLFMGIPLAQAGFFTVLLDARNHGRRKPANWAELYAPPQYKRTYVQALIDTCDDISRLIDHLEHDPRVDATRIGITGISQGGYMSFMAITRDKRISVAAPMIGSPDLEATFGSSLPLDQYPPDVQQFAIAHSPLRHFARMPPTALLIQHGDADPIVPVAGVRRLDELLRPLYRDLPGRYEYREHTGVGHNDVGMREATIAWLRRHLAPERPA